MNFKKYTSEIFYYIVFLLSIIFLMAISFVDNVNVNEPIRNIILSFLGLNILEKMFTDSSELVINGKVRDIFYRKLIVFIIFLIYNIFIYLYKREVFDIINFYIIICAILLTKGGDYFASSVNFVGGKNEEEEDK